MQSRLNVNTKLNTLLRNVPYAKQSGNLKNIESRKLQSPIDPVYLDIDQSLVNIKQFTQ